MPSKINLTFIDYSGETSSVAARFDTLTAANFAAENALAQAFRAAAEGVSIGNLQKYTLLANEVKFTVGLPTIKHAQRENKWLVRMVDSNGNATTLEIPCPDMELLSTNSDKLDIATPEGAALVAAINGKVRSNDGELLTFVEAVLVGRSI